MSLLDEVGTYLQSAGVGSLSTTLFLGQWPDAATDAIVVVLETGGAGGTETMGSDTLPAWENPTIQVVCRGDAPDPAGSKTPYVSARAKAKTAWEALTKVANETLSSTRYLRITPLQSPFLIGRDSADRPLIGFNCLVAKVPS